MKPTRAQSAHISTDRSLGPVHWHRVGARDPKPSACDDGPFGKGTGGELTYSLALPANGSQTVWLGVAGSDQGGATGPRPGPAGVDQGPAEPVGSLGRQDGLPPAASSETQLSLPGDPTVQNAVDWGKQNIADLTLSAQNLQIRWTNQGNVPRTTRRCPTSDLDRRRLSRLSTVSSERTGSTRHSLPLVCLSPRSWFARAATNLRHPATTARVWSFTSRCPTARSGSVTTPGRPHKRHHHVRLQHGRDGQVPQCRCVRVAAGTVTRFRDQMYDFTVRNLKYVVNQLDAFRRRLAGGARGNV